MTVRGWLCILQRCPFIAISTSSVLLWNPIILTSFPLIHNSNLIIIRINQLFYNIFLTLNTNIVKFLLIEVYLGANKNLRSVPRHTKIHYLYFFWRYLLLHSPSIEIAILWCGNANICQLLYLTRMCALLVKDI